MRNVWAITRSTLKEAMKRKSMILTLLFSLLFILGIGAITQQGMKRGGSEAGDLVQTFQIEGTLRTISFFGALLTLFITMNAIPLEIERRTIYTLLAKPIERYQFVLGKFIGCYVLLGFNLLLMALVGFVLILQHNPTYASALVRSFGVLYLRLIPLCSLTLLFSVFMPSIGAALLAWGVYLLGQGPGAFHQVAETDGVYPALRWGAGLLYPVVKLLTPRVNLLNIEAPILESPILESPDQMRAAILVTIYAAVCVLFTCIVFGRKEL